MAEKTCGKCEHYEKYEDNVWGYCRCPVPVWVTPDLNISTALVEENDSKAEKCPCFKVSTGMVETSGDPVPRPKIELPKPQKIFSDEKPKEKRGRKPKKGKKN